MRLFILSIILLVSHCKLAEAQLRAPESVPVGQAIHFVVEDSEQGLEARWTLLNPFDGVEIKEIRPKGSNDLIVDPPCGWSGKIRVQLILLDSERRVVDIRTSIVQVGSPDNPPNPPNPPPVDPKPDDNGPKPDENEPKPEYSGLNELGMGSESYELAPEMEPIELEMVANVMDQAALHLRGFGGLKVIQARGSHQNTEHELYYWLDLQMQRYPAFREWYEGCMQYKEKLGVGIGSPIDLHVQLLNEMAAGLRGAK